MFLSLSFFFSFPRIWYRITESVDDSHAACSQTPRSHGCLLCLKSTCAAHTQIISFQCMSNAIQLYSQVKMYLHKEYFVVPNTPITHLRQSDNNNSNHWGKRSLIRHMKNATNNRTAYIMSKLPLYEAYLMKITVLLLNIIKLKIILLLLLLKTVINTYHDLEPVILHITVHPLLDSADT